MDEGIKESKVKTLRREARHYYGRSHFRVCAVRLRDLSCMRWGHGNDSGS